MKALVGRHFQQGKGPSWFLLRDCEIFANLCLKLYCLPTPCSSCDGLVSRRQCDRLRLADAGCMQMVAQPTAALVWAGRGAGVFRMCLNMQQTRQLRQL